MEDEHERLLALADLNILEAESDPYLEVFPALASQLFKAPIAAITLITEDTQFVRAGVGLDSQEVPRSLSLCEHAILSPNDVLHVADAATDPRFSDNRAVTADPGVRAYAAVPIAGPTGHTLGTLCVADYKPRQFSDELLSNLRQLAVGVEGAIRLHAAAEKNRVLSLTDALTGLGNRAHYEQSITAALSPASLASNQRVALLFVDIDEFKSINDLFGHSGGDSALQEFARRLQDSTGSLGTVFRIGGDEFCILIGHLQHQALVELVATRIHSGLGRPFSIEQQSVPLRASIGVAVIPQHAENSEALVQAADAALYEAKLAGRGTTSFARPRTGSAAPCLGRQEMRRALRKALVPPGQEPFELAMQPIVNARTGSLTGFEALVRWPGKDGLHMQPGEFIPTAEASGLIVQLDRWVMHSACSTASCWPEHLTVSCNVSATNLFSGNLVEEVRKALRNNGLKPNRLKLEVTETILLRDTPRVKGIIRELREAGLEVVLDDFGTGNASLAYLRDYAFSGLKIDRSFVDGLTDDPRRRILVRAIVDMAHALGLSVTAEGIETREQCVLLQREKVAFLQGYHFGRPLPAHLIADYLYGGAGLAKLRAADSTPHEDRRAATRCGR